MKKLFLFLFFYQKKLVHNIFISNLPLDITNKNVLDFEGKKRVFLWWCHHLFESAKGSLPSENLDQLTSPCSSCRYARHEDFTERLSGHQAEQPALQEGAGGEEHPAHAVGPGAAGVTAADGHQADQVSDPRRWCRGSTGNKLLKTRQKKRRLVWCFFSGVWVRGRRLRNWNRGTYWSVSPRGEEKPIKPVSEWVSSLFSFSQLAMIRRSRRRRGRSKDIYLKRYVFDQRTSVAPFL